MYGVINFRGNYAYVYAIVSVTSSIIHRILFVYTLHRHCLPNDYKDTAIEADVYLVNNYIGRPYSTLSID